MIVEDPINLLVYGPPGHGKTTLLGTVVGDPRLSPMLLLEFEGGTLSIRSKCRKVPIDQLGVKPGEVDLIDVVSIRSFEDFYTVYDFLVDNDHNYVSVGLDSLSEMNYLNLSESLQVALRDDKRHDLDILEQRDYLRSSSQMRKMLRGFRDLPMNFFVTAGVQTVQDPRTRENKAAPSLTGKLTFEVPGLLDVVGYLALVDFEDGSVQRWLYCQPTGRFEAKDRTEGGRLGEYIVEPTLPKILNLIDGIE